MRRKLPTALFAAWNWTHAAGEIPTLKGLTGKELETYATEAAANASDHGCRDVSASDLRDLAAWLRNEEVRS